MRPRIRSLGRRIRLPRSLQARTTLAATLAALVLFSAGAWGMRHVIYTQRMNEAHSEAVGEVERIMSTVTATSWPDGDTSWGQYPYELVSSTDTLASSETIAPYESGRRAFMPLPAEGSGQVPYLGSTVVHFPDGGPLAGTTLSVVTGTLNAGDLPRGQSNPSARALSGGERVRVYVFVTTTAAQEAVAAIDRILYPGIPASVLLVAAVAFISTRRALRPVEQIRARTAAVTATDPRERVAVPKTGDEIARLAVTINETLERLDSALRTHRRFVADAAHELRSPLASLLATLEVAEAYPDRADWPETVATSARQARRIQALADDLLLLARLSSTARRTDEPVDLAALAQDVATDLAARHAYASRAPALSVVDDTGGLALVRGNASQLERMLRNLVENATRFAHEKVDVSVSVRGTDAALTVQDDGPGIPLADRGRVFDRFTRLDDDRSRETGGSGLGLAIAREIAELHQGTLRVDESAQGARLTARLPLSQEKRPEERQPSPTP